MRSYEKTYNTLVEVGDMVQADGFFDDEAGSFEKTGEIYADVQPYNGGLAEKEYGQVGDVSYRIYCSLARELLEQGKVVKMGDEYYKLTYAEHWESGSMALISKRL